MKSIAIIDFDGVIAEVTSHAEKARELARAFARKLDTDTTSEVYRKAVREFFYSERGFFNDSLVELDQLIPGSDKALAQLLDEHEKVVVLTSRPHFMRDITLKWFDQYCPGIENIDFVFKDTDERIIKTAAWKADTVASYARSYKKIVFIDDDERNRKAVEALAAQLEDVTLIIKPSFEECLNI